MLSDDDLKTRTLLSSKAMEHREELPHFLKIGIPLRFFDATSSGLVNLL